MEKIVIFYDPFEKKRLLNKYKNYGIDKLLIEPILLRDLLSAGFTIHELDSIGITEKYYSKFGFNKNLVKKFSQINEIHCTDFILIKEKSENTKILSTDIVSIDIPACLSSNSKILPQLSTNPIKSIIQNWFSNGNQRKLQENTKIPIRITEKNILFNDIKL